MSNSGPSIGQTGEAGKEMCPIEPSYQTNWRGRKRNVSNRALLSDKLERPRRNVSNRALPIRQIGEARKEICPIELFYRTSSRSLNGFCAISFLDDFYL